MENARADNPDEVFMMMKKVAAVFLFALLVRFLLLDATPFYRDEALYAEIIGEMIGGSGLMPHYAGVPVPWKPPLTFWLYSPPLSSLGHLNILPVEILYRLPGVFLGALCSVLVYLIVKELEDDDLAFLSAIAYSGTALSVFVNRMVLTDSLLSFFILSSVLCYLKANGGARLILLGGFLSGLAVFTKTIAGLFAPALVVAYYALTDRKFLLRRDFLGSLVFIPLAFALLAFFVPGMASQYSIDSSQRTAGLNLGHSLGENTMVFLGLTAPWLMVALYGAFKFSGGMRHKNLWLIWLLLGLVPLFSNGPLFWYFLPLIPAISVFSGRVVLAGGKADSFATTIAISLTLVSLGALYFIHSAYISEENLDSQRSLGLYLSGKDALLISEYAPTVLYYAFKGDWSDGRLDAFFIINSSELNPSEVRGLIAHPAIPKNSLNFSEAILYPNIPRRMHLGDFSRQRDFIALSKELYEEFEPTGALAGFEKTYEDGNFIVLRKTSS